MVLFATEKDGDFMTLEISILISVVSVCFAVYFGLRNNKRADIKEIEQRVKERTETNMKLDEICRTVTDIKESIVEMKRDVQALSERIAIVEKKVDKAHMRIDIIEGKDIVSTEG